MPRKVALSTEDAFLQAILENPDDDMPRLVFADWLEEQGNPRGTFIRLQIQRSTMTRFDPGWAGVLAQESKLYRQFEPEWSKPILRLVDEVEYRRGFIEHVRVSGAKLAKSAERLFRLAPISSLRLHRIQGLAMSAVMAHCGHGQVRELDLSDNMIGSKALEALLEADAFRKVRSVCLRRCGLREADAKVLTAGGYLEGLQALNLSSNDFHAEAAQMLAACSHLGSLRDLNLNDNKILAAGAIALAGAPALRLIRLSLGANWIDNEGTAAIAESASCANLRSLDLEGNHITNRGVESLVNSPHLTQLENLNLSGNRISTGGVQILTESPLLTGLTTLNLKHNDIDKATALTLPQRFATQKMRELLY